MTVAGRDEGVRPSGHGDGASLARAESESDGGAAQQALGLGQKVSGATGCAHICRRCHATYRTVEALVATRVADLEVIEALPRPQAFKLTVEAARILTISRPPCLLSTQPARRRAFQGGHVGSAAPRSELIVASRLLPHLLLLHLRGSAQFSQILVATRTRPTSVISSRAWPRSKMTFSESLGARLSTWPRRREHP